MSLLSEGSGILQSHVEYEEVERNLQVAFRTQAKLGVGRKAEHIGEGNGFMSRIALITCDWEGAEKDEELPEKFALKLPTCLALKSLEDQMPADLRSNPVAMEAIWNHLENYAKKTHNLETRVYEFMENFEEKLAVPRCFFSVPFIDSKINGSLALEYLADTRISHIYENMDVKLVEEVAREVGKVQALFHLNGIENEKWISDNDIYSDFWKNYSVETYNQMFDQLKDADETMTESVDAFTSLTRHYHGSNLPIVIHKQKGIRPVFVIGDLWTANVLINKKTEKLRGIVDFQLVHLGTGVEDFLRFSVSAMSSEDRRSHMPSLLDLMYDSLVENLNGTEPPYTRKQLHELHDILLPHAVYFFAPMPMPVLKVTGADPFLSEEEKDMRKRVVFDKLRGLFEDVVECFNKNARE